MKLPRDLSGESFAKAASAFGYAVTRQTGSHLRLTTQENSEHHLTIPRHKALRVGTLAAAIQEICEHFHLDRQTVCRRLFGPK